MVLLPYARAITVYCQKELKFCRFSVPIQQIFHTLTKQDRQRTYNVTMRRVRATIVAVEKQYVLQILSVCL